jgi:hypothetical protein
VKLIVNFLRVNKKKMILADKALNILWCLQPVNLRRFVVHDKHFT